MITEVEDPVEQKIQLNAFVANRFANSMAGKSQELADALKRLTLHSMQKYRIRYLLARLTQHVDMAFRGQRARSNLDPFYNLHIEHILPNNPTAGLLGDWTNENPGVDYNDYKNRLGNLTLLEQPINVVANNDFYASKQELYQQSGNYLTRSLVNLANVGQNNAITRINTQLQAFPTWNAASIETRHEMLIALAQDVWKTTPIDV